jgi:hypothetical protein
MKSVSIMHRIVFLSEYDTGIMRDLDYVKNDNDYVNTKNIF